MAHKPVFYEQLPSTNPSLSTVPMKKGSHKLAATIYVILAKHSSSVFDPIIPTVPTIHEFFQCSLNTITVFFVRRVKWLALFWSLPLYPASATPPYFLCVLRNEDLWHSLYRYASLNDGDAFWEMRR